MAGAMVDSVVIIICAKLAIQHCDAAGYVVVRLKALNIVVFVGPISAIFAPTLSLPLTSLEVPRR